MKLQLIMASNYCCDFASETSTCQGESILLKDCTRDISNHLKKLHQPADSVSNERSLILSRYGIYGKFQNTTRKRHICVHHRDILGLKYRPPKDCMHPTHSSSRAPEKDRSVSIQCAKEIHEATGQVISVGAGIFATLFSGNTKEAPIVMSCLLNLSNIQLKECGTVSLVSKLITLA